MSELLYSCTAPDDTGANDSSCIKTLGNCPLQTVSVTGLIRDAVAQYTIVQTFANPLKDAAIEAIYTFPLYEGVAVCGFAAEVDDRKIVGRVQETVAARKEYESAKKAGKVASILQQETPDVFQASVGNIPPSKTVAIRITLVSEIKQDTDENQVRFVMPTTIAPRYGHWGRDSPLEDSNTDTSAARLVVDMSCAMSNAITSIQSPSHTIEVHLGTTASDAASTAHDPNRMRVSLTADSLLDRDLVIIVQALGLDAPRALVERHPKYETHAISLTFSPRFTLIPVRSSELIFIVDRSGSMADGSRIKQASAALELFLRSIPCEDHYFNVIGFGSEHRALFPKSVPYNADSLEKSVRYAETLRADMGGTEMTSAFQEAFERQRRDVPTQILLLTDGEMWGVDTLCKIIREAVDERERTNSFVRVFSLGIGNAVSHDLIESVARAGGGYAQLVVEGERMEKKVLNMLKSALVPPVTNLGVSWSSEVMNSEDEVEDFVFVEAEDDPNESDSTDTTPIDLFSTSPRGPPLPPPGFPPPASPSPSPPCALPPGPPLPPPRVVVSIHQAPFKIPILSPGARFTVYAILSATMPVPEELVLQGSSPDGPVELKVRIEAVQEGETMLHSLAARAIVRDLEAGSSYIHALRTDATATQRAMLKRLGVHVVTPEGKKYTSDALSAWHATEIARERTREIAMRYKFSSKYTSWVAVDEETQERIVYEFEDTQPYGTHVSREAEGTYYSEERRERSGAVMMRRPVQVASCTSSYTPSLLPFHLPDASELEEESEEPMIAATDPHSRLRSTLRHQSFDGSFPLVPEIAALFSTTVEELNGRLAEVRKQCAVSTLSGAEWEAIWATCLAVELMRKQLPELQDEWELVVEKAEKRVEALLRNGDDVAAIREAAAVVAGGGSGDQQRAGDGVESKAAVETVDETDGHSHLTAEEASPVPQGNSQKAKKEKEEETSSVRSA